MSRDELRNTLKVQRARLDWTQEELARRIGVTRKTVNTIENGVYVPSTSLALKMARVFGLRVEDLFQLPDEASAGPGGKILADNGNVSRE
jgi:putative transcriptional regulator